MIRPAYLRTSFDVWSEWGPRKISIDEITERFISTVNQLKNIHSDLDGWYWLTNDEDYEFEGEEDISTLSEVLPRIGAAIRENMGRDVDSGQQVPKLGYEIYILTTETTEIPYCSLTICDSCTQYSGLFGSNKASFRVNDDNYKINPLVNYDTYRAVTLAIAETWNVTWAKAFPDNLVKSVSDWDGSRPGWGWMVYLSPYLSRLVSPPSNVIVEHRPNGGLFMAATTEVFDSYNSSHIASARAIRDALLPITNREDLYELPYE